MKPRRTATLDRVTSDHLLKSDPAAADLDAAFAADLRFARMMNEFNEVALMPESVPATDDERAAFYADVPTCPICGSTEPVHYHDDDDEFDARNAQETEARQAIRDENDWSRGL